MEHCVEELMEHYVEELMEHCGEELVQSPGLSGCDIYYIKMLGNKKSYQSQ